MEAIQLARTMHNNWRAYPVGAYFHQTFGGGVLPVGTKGLLTSTSVVKVDGVDASVDIGTTQWKLIGGTKHED